MWKIRLPQPQLLFVPVWQTKANLHAQYVCVCVLLFMQRSEGVKVKQVSVRQELQ